MGRRARRAVVVGGGTGGLAAAVALQSASIDVVVLEKALTLDAVQVGGGHILWHNAVLALRRLGLGDAVEAVAPVVERYEFRTSAGRLLATWPVGERGRELGVPTVAIGRPALHRILREAAGDVVREGAAAVAVRQDGDGATVVLADGSEERGDVVVGADGLRSVVRSQVLGPAEPVYAGYTAWQGVTSFADRSVPDGVFTNTSGPGIRFFSFRIDRGDTVYWDGVIGARAGGKKQTKGTRRETLLAQFGQWHAPIPSLIESTAEDTITAIDIYDRNPVSTWGEGRITLLGDAAHPSTFNLGQGACQALEDAVVLGRTLAAHDDAVVGLRAYEGSRMKRTAAMTVTARRIGKIEQVSNPLVCRLRDAFVSVAHERLVLRQTYALMMSHDL